MSRELSLPRAALDYDGRHVAVVTLNNPPHNVLTAELRDDLNTIFDHLDEDIEVRCVLIKSAIPAFTAGGDLREDEALTDDGVHAYLQAGSALLNRIERYRAPVIAAINGAAIGGGLEFVLTCDIRLASTEAFFVAAGVNVGLIVSFWRLPRLIGLGPAKEILLTGKRYSAEQALRWGLVTGVHEPDELVPAALDLARRIAGRAPLSVEAAKRSALEALDLSSEESERLQAERFVEMFRSEDHREALKAFFERREGNFVRR